MTQLAKIAVAAATYAIDKPYDYLVPETMESSVGSRVTVPFGRGNRHTEGVILSLSHAYPQRSVKSILALVDETPVISPAEIKLALWMRERYFCTFYEAIKTILPASVWYHYRQVYRLAAAEMPDSLSEQEQSIWQELSSRGPMDSKQLSAIWEKDLLPVLKKMEQRGILFLETEAKRPISDKTVKLVSLTVDAPTALDGKTKSSPRRAEAIRFLQDYGETVSNELCYYTGITPVMLRHMEKAGIITFREMEQYRVPHYQKKEAAVPVSLNKEQQQAFAQLWASIQVEKPTVSLLQGVTGSGKTQVYIRLAQEAVKLGRSVMILVPEIALTPQMMERFATCFGDEVAMLHSGLRLSERYDQWKRLQRGEAHIVLGTRSAVFAPLDHLGLIVMDEEQESSYQSFNAPFYHARDIAKYRCVQDKALLLLGSATPTVETAYFARSGVYGLAKLLHRYNERPLPQVILADLRQELCSGNTGAVSSVLYRELKKNIESGEQSILFLNRRGNSRMLLCGECGSVPQCPRCSVPLTYHSVNERLMCHYCGYSEKAYETCPDCGGRMKHVGIGTQKVEEELRRLFPGTEILRMDADTVSAANNHEKLLRRFSQQKIPVLLGTQMVAKGLDFENVTLVGVLSADLSLYVDHYTASERTFSLLTQVVGRAGRGEKAGRAVIQTFTPGNDVIEAAAAQDYDRFYDSEIRLRKLRMDPPFSDQFFLTVSGREEAQVRRASSQLRDGLVSAAKAGNYEILDILGPAPAPVVKVNNRYRYRVLLTGKNDKTIRGLIAAFMREFAAKSENRGMNLYTDCNLAE
ncbi:MAG: primosomal protein N' [Oscillibacter sp.]|nr:primosomal protein N' [Oscillibacter sp.]